jgi:hypothetical protein
MTFACPGRQPVRWLIVAGLAVLLFAALAAGASAQAQGGDNTTCLGCHSNPGLSTQLASGETLPLTVDPQVYHSSVHTNLTCTSCHTNISGYPHPKLTAGDRRSFQLERYQQCKTCHQDQYMQSLDSNHARELAAGNRNAAICTDCHGAHNVTKPDQPRQRSRRPARSAIVRSMINTPTVSTEMHSWKTATPTSRFAPTVTALTRRRIRRPRPSA